METINKKSLYREVTGTLDDCREEMVEFYSNGFDNGYKFGICGSLKADQSSTLIVCDEVYFLEEILKRGINVSFVIPLDRFSIADLDELSPL